MKTSTALAVAAVVCAVTLGPAGGASAQASQDQSHPSRAVTAQAFQRVQVAVAPRLWRPAATAVGAPVPGSALVSPAASPWRIEPTPNPDNQPNAAPLGVSCTSAVTCIEVGNYINTASAVRPLAQEWNGQTWTVQTAHSPVGAAGSSFEAVSCSAPDACTAVGYYSARHDVRGLAEAWDGRTWTVQPTPDPMGATTTVLFAVSCTKADTCTAVGEALIGKVYSPVAERWDGARWSLQATPGLGGDSALFGVSCATADSCTAVGSYASSGSDLPLAEAWNGTTWAPQAVPNPAGSATSPLLAVSCTTPGTCTAVGSSTSRAGRTTLAEAWNGTAWSIQTTPDPPSANPDAELTGVSCTAPDMCSVVGAYVNNASHNAPLAETWNGSTWSIQATPSLSPFDLPSSVSCAAASFCVSAGFLSYVPSVVEPSSTLLPLTEVWNGTTWALQATPRRPGVNFASFTSVSCPAAKACTAVGQQQYYRASRFVVAPIAETWDGRRWALQPIPANTSIFANFAYSVSCASARVCVAVGATGPLDPSKTVGLAWAWDGTRWHKLAVHDSVGSPTGWAFSGVSCASPRFCIAVGGDSNAMAETWDGVRWTRQHVPVPAGASFTYLSTVSCVSARACVALGSTDSGELAESWDGFTWSIMPAPASAHIGLSCTSRTACTAVGLKPAGPHRFLPTAESWNGRRWADQAVPLPASRRSGEFSAVSCTSASDCTAVGYSIAGHWNGSRWTTVVTPAPVGVRSFLRSVSCVSSPTCTAVGSAGVSLSESVTLAVAR